MRIIIVSASSRKNSESFRVSTYVKNELEKDSAMQVELISLQENPVPLWEQDENPNEERKECMRVFENADGFIFVIPEWNGMAPPGLRNLFLCAEYEMAHKPCLLIGVTVGLSGAYPLIEMRACSYKNSRICYLPEQMVIKQVHKFLKTEKPQDEIDEMVRERITYCLSLLKEYTKALKGVRESGVVDHKSFPSGM